MQSEDLHGIGSDAIFDSGLPKHPYFGLEPGDMEVTPLYANNEIFALEIRFSVSPAVWSEFQTQPFFRELIERLKSHAQETLEMHKSSCAPECKVGNWEYVGSSSAPEHRELFLEKARKWVQKRKYPQL